MGVWNDHNFVLIFLFGILMIQSSECITTEEMTTIVDAIIETTAEDSTPLSDSTTISGESTTYEGFKPSTTSKPETNQTESDVSTISIFPTVTDILENPDNGTTQTETWKIVTFSVLVGITGILTIIAVLVLIKCLCSYECHCAIVKKTSATGKDPGDPMINNNTDTFIPDVLKYDNNLKRVTLVYPMTTFAGEDVNESDTDRNSIIGEEVSTGSVQEGQDTPNTVPPPPPPPPVPPPPPIPPSSEADLDDIQFSSIQFYSTYLTAEPPPQEPPTMLPPSLHVEYMLEGEQSDSQQFYSNSTYLTHNNSDSLPPPPPLPSTHHPPSNTPRIPPAQLLPPPPITSGFEGGLSESSLYSTSIANLSDIQSILEDQDRSSQIRQSIGQDNDAYLTHTYLEPEEIQRYLANNNSSDHHSYQNLAGKYPNEHSVSDTNYVNFKK